MAILGGLLRSSMCRWIDGMALKKEQPGTSKVCMIMGTVKRLPSWTIQMEPQTSCTMAIAKMAHTTMGP